MMNTFNKLYKEFFGIKEQTEQGSISVKDPKTAEDLAKKGLDVTLVDEAQLVNHIYDYRGGVEYVLRDPSQAKEVATQIQQWTEKKGFTIVKHTLSPTGKVGYFYFRLGQDPEREAQRIQGYFSSKLEIKFFRFKVKEEQPQQVNTEI